MRPALAVLAVAFLSSCGRDLDPVAPPAPGGRELIVTTISVTPTIFHAGETVRIEVTISNPSDRVAHLCFSSGCTVGWHARDAAGEVVAPGPMLCTTEAPCFDMGPGESRTGSYQWSGNRYEPLTGRFEDLPPGNYQLRGGLDHIGQSRSSAPVTVELLAR